ncbi:MAG TPA: hypothetical protein VGL18_06215 [Actinomycetota bacterium]
MLVASAAVILVAGGAIATARVLHEEPSSPPGLEEAIGVLFPPDRCIRPEQGKRIVRAELDRLGFTDWTVVANRTNANEPCVFAGFAPGDRKVILVRWPTPELSRAIRALDERLWTECFNEAQVRELIGAELTRLGVTDWSIEVNKGAEPGDQARRRHLEDGCFVLVGSIHKEDGPVIYLINGDLDR